MVDIDNIHHKSNCQYIIILLYVGVAHGLSLLNDGIYWDGWIYYLHLLDKDWPSIYIPFRDTGIPLYAYFHWLMGYFPGVIFGYRLIALLTIAGSGLFVYRICIDSKLISQAESLLITLLTISYPVFHNTLSLTPVPVNVSYFCFFLATFLALRSEKSNNKTRYILRISALTLFVLSFLYRSHLVFFFGFLIFLLISVKRVFSFSRKHIIIWLLRYRFYYVLLPFLYWLTNENLFPVGDFHAGYNQLLLSPLVFLKATIFFLYFSVYSQLNNALKELISHPAIWLFILFSILWVNLKMKTSFNHLFESKIKPHSLLFFGLVLLFLAIFPYAIVGKWAVVHAWESRHALLIPLPLSIILIASTRIVFNNKTKYLSKYGLFLLISVVSGFTLSSLKGYLTLQSRWIKDRSIMTNLATIKNSENISVFWVDDLYPVGNERSYNFYEWSSIFKNIWKDESHIGLDRKLYAEDFLIKGRCFFNHQNHLRDFDPTGRQAVLTIHRGPISYGNFGLSVRYLYYKFFQKHKLREFLSKITDVQIKPILNSKKDKLNPGLNQLSKIKKDTKLNY